MLTKEQEIKVGLMNRANWLKSVPINVATGELCDIYKTEPKTAKEKVIREIEKKRDEYLMAFDLEPAIKLQQEINELEAQEWISL